MKRSIGIDINRDKISMVQLCFTGGKFSLERASVRKIHESGSSEENSTTDIKAVINSMLTEDKFDMSAKVAVTAPTDKVFFHNFRTDLSANEDVQQLIKFELEDDFPIPFDELVAGICGSRELNGNDREYLIGAINRMELQGRIKTIKQANLKCSNVTPDVCALYAAVSINHNLIDNIPSVIIHADNSRIILAISEKGRLICVRHFNSQDLTEVQGGTSVQVLTREIEMTVRAVFGPDTDTRRKVFISSNNKLLDGLFERLPGAMNCEVVALNPFAKIDYPEQQPNPDIVIAAGLAMIGTNEIPDVLNFIAIDELRSDQTVEIKRGLYIAGALLLAIGVLLIAMLFNELNNLENRHELVKKQIREVFVQTLPQEKKIVNELAQLNEKLESSQAQYNALAAGLSDRVSPLRILQIISEKITSDQNVRINDISMAPESVRLAGVAPSFESVDNLMSLLRQVSGFDTVEVPSIDVDPQGRGVRFKLSIKTIMK
ncbi:MAG: pilus assembly protein PilM [Sedimentisphaerales bacterium]|nr:pilus assembly protein PilM [Sedimentisphaerales bacterium]